MLVEFLLGFIILALLLITFYAISEPLGSVILKKFGRTITFGKGIVTENREAGMLVMGEVVFIVVSVLLVSLISVYIGKGLLG